MTLILPTRTPAIIEKISRKETGLNGSIFVGVDFVETGNRREIVSIQVFEKGKDGSNLDRILTAVGEKLTAIIRREINGGGG